MAELGFIIPEKIGGVRIGKAVRKAFENGEIVWEGDRLVRVPEGCLYIVKSRRIK